MGAKTTPDITVFDAENSGGKIYNFKGFPEVTGRENFANCKSVQIDIFVHFENITRNAKFSLPRALSLVIKLFGEYRFVRFIFSPK